MERSSRVGDALLEAKGEQGAMEAKLQVRPADRFVSTWQKAAVRQAGSLICDEAGCMPGPSKGSCLCMD